MESEKYFERRFPSSNKWDFPIEIMAIGDAG